jgi:hypothetical protein
MSCALAFQGAGDGAREGIIRFLAAAAMGRVGISVAAVAVTVVWAVHVPRGAVVTASSVHARSMFTAILVVTAWG